MKKVILIVMVATLISTVVFGSEAIFHMADIVNKDIGIEDEFPVMYFRTYDDYVELAKEGNWKLDETTYEELEDALDKGGFIPSNGCIGALTYYSQTYKIFSKHFEEIFEIINNEYDIYYGEKYCGELNYNMLVWIAFELLTYRWHGAILTLME